MLLSTEAVAEGGCPPGTYPANPPATNVCNPFPDSQANSRQPTPPQPRGRWETRWGAIAIDNVKGKLGGVINRRSKHAAEEAALKECYSRGEGNNKNCKVKLTYYNQCASVAWGEESYAAAGRDMLEEANRNAVENCSKATPNCKVVYNACSNAKWISY